ncbi:MAG: hypothetical protein AB1730_19705 [Myxococcota bacterium]
MTQDSGSGRKEQKTSKDQEPGQRVEDTTQPGLPLGDAQEEPTDEHAALGEAEESTDEHAVVQE